MNNIYLKKLPLQGFATTKSSLQQFVQHAYQMQHTSIFYCISGEALFTIDGHKYRFTQGEIIICPEGSNILLLDITSDFSARLLGLSKHIWLAARSSMTPEMVHGIERNTFKGENSELEKEFLSNIFRQIDIMDTEAGNNVENTEYCRQNVILAVNSLLLYIQQINKKNTVQNKEYISDNKDKLFYEFRMLLTEKFREDRSVQFYADKLNVTPKYFNTICKQVSGKTASKIINEEIVTQAHVMLKDHDLSIKQISSILGFTNQSHFGSFIRKETGLSPQLLRKKEL